MVFWWAQNLIYNVSKHITVAGKDLNSESCGDCNQFWLCNHCLYGSQIKWKSNLSITVSFDIGLWGFRVVLIFPRFKVHVAGLLGTSIKIFWGYWQRSKHSHLTSPSHVVYSRLKFYKSKNFAWIVDPRTVTSSA